MAQTALQELIQRLQVAFERGDKKYKPAFEYWLDEAKNLLPKERQDILDGYNQGYREGEIDGVDNGSKLPLDVSKYDDASNYFTQTFN